MEICALIGEVDVGVFGQVGFELLLLPGSPGQRQTCADDDLCCGQAAVPQLFPDSGQRQDVVVRGAAPQSAGLSRGSSAFSRTSFAKGKAALSMILSWRNSLWPVPMA